MSNGNPDFPPDPPDGKCVTEHDNAVSKFFDMQRAESEAINAVQKAKNVASAAAVACAAAVPAGPVGFTACVAGVGATMAALDDAKSKNDLFGIAIQQFNQAEQTLLDCISNAGIIIEGNNE